ncbi:MAG: aminotransferase class III-fold pyridoxal phosphate-dependent enzyme [Thermorudis peleae]|nr:aminotransferase class III-fold pyridoxal phosphate-dependent enzyme [Thermorudis peleae]
MTEQRSTQHASWLVRADRALGGALNRFTLPSTHAFVIAEGRGSRVYDVDGRAYIDYVLGSGPLLLGHAHPAVVEAVCRQASRGSTFYWLNEPIIQLAEALIEAVPCAERVKFVSTGTEATMHAIRIARAYTGRARILKFEGGFHGVHDYALQSAVSPTVADYPAPRADAAGIPEPVSETVLVSQWNDLALTEQLICAYADELAAVICEPLQRALPPEPGFLEGLRALTARYGIVLIFDEIVTGFRLAYGGAQERYGVVPDLATFGKALGGGYPIAAIAGRAELMELTDPRRRARGLPEAHLSGTFNGNPIAAAAGLATLQVLRQPGVYDQLYRVTDRLTSGLRALAAKRRLPLQVIGEGPLFQVVFAERPPRNYADIVASDRERARRFGLACLEQGLFVVPGEKYYVSLAHTDADVDETLAAFARALDVITAQPAG